MYLLYNALAPAVGGQKHPALASLGFYEAIPCPNYSDASLSLMGHYGQAEK
jgi:hypothetical protein